MTTRTVSFYVLWDDRTWDEEDVELEGSDAEMGDEDAVELARAMLQSDLDSNGDLVAIGPLCSLGEVEEDDSDSEDLVQNNTPMEDRT